MSVIIPDVPDNLDPYVFRYLQILKLAVEELQARVDELES